MEFKQHDAARFVPRARAWRALNGLLAALGTAPASAQVNERQVIEAMMTKVAGTQRVYAQPYMTAGKLAGCNLVFEAMIRDFTYRQGQFIKVDGSIGIMAIGGAPGAVLKVVVNEIDPPSLTFTPSPPSRAYLFGPKFNTNVESLVSATESDTPGSLFSVFQVTPTLDIVLSALELKKVTVAFNKKGGSSDIQLPLELDVAQTDDEGVRTRSDQAATEFSQCLLVLFEQFKQ